MVFNPCRDNSHPMSDGTALPGVRNKTVLLRVLLCDPLHRDSNALYSAEC
jgi:hypothetical protein